MGKINLTKLLETQISLTEWFEVINHKDVETIKEEDSTRRDRLAILNKVIGLPYDQPRSFPASQIPPSFLKNHGGETCGLRLNPIDRTLPKLRLRGKTVKQAYAWFTKQAINKNRYRVDFIPHSNHQLHSMIFIANKHGIFGEYIKGGHYQLTQGFYDQGKPARFSYDFHQWKIDSTNHSVLKYIKRVVNQIRITDASKRNELKKSLKAQFCHNYLVGYFETLTTKDYGLWFIDYNRVLVRLLRGYAGSQGKVIGKARIILKDQVRNSTINSGEILVTEMTTPDYLPLIVNAAGIITNMGGILSHAAIICRELKKPCLVGTMEATKRFKDGDIIELDTYKGTASVKTNL